jgi:hypothetical protein
MKKKLLFAAALVVIACTFTSCTKTCKTCTQVAYVNGSYDHDVTSAQEYCGLELTALEALDPVTLGDTTTKWVCN